MRPNRWETTDLVTFIEETFNGKLLKQNRHFEHKLCKADMDSFHASSFSFAF